VSQFALNRQLRRLFVSLAAARAVIERWWPVEDLVRPHSVQDELTPHAAVLRVVSSDAAF